MKKVFDSIWYAWPRFPGAVFHLSCTVATTAVFIYGIVCIIHQHNPTPTPHHQHHHTNTHKKAQCKAYKQ